MFSCVSYHLGAFRTIWVHLRPFGCLTKLRAKCFEQVRKFVARRRVGVFCYEHTRSTPLDPKHMFWSVSFHLRTFGTVRLPYKTRAKHSELVQNLVRRGRVELFNDERTRSTPLVPKLMFWCFSYYLGAFRTVFFPYETRCKMGRTSAKVRATKLLQNF